MAITSIADLASGFLANQVEKSNRSQQSSLARLSSGNAISQASVDVSALSQAISLQSQVSNLRTASVNIAQASSLLQVADGGFEEIGQALERLSALSVQANSGALSDDARKGLQKEADALFSEINRIASQTTFNGVSLLDGSLSQVDEQGAIKVQTGASSSDLAEFTIGDFRTSALFASPLDFSSQEAASQSLDAIQNAARLVFVGRAQVGAAQQGFDIAGATLESAIQNQEAARSTLEDTDLNDYTQTALNAVQAQASTALLAQSSRLKPAILNLLNA